MTNATLRAELIEVFSEQISSRVRRQFANLAENFGEQFKGIHNSGHASVWVETVRPCCERSGDRANATYSLNEGLLTTYSAALAETMADEVLAKVDAKVGDLEQPKVRRVGGADFVISGIKKGHQVTIEQNQIINCSTRGKLFNQYPSRIYVNGKATSAAKFAAI